MRSINRGLRSFRRHPLRNLVVVLLLFVCLTFSLSMLAVKLAADSQVEEVKQSVGNYAEIRVSSDYQMAVFEEELSQEESERAAQARTMSDEEMLEQMTRFLVPEDLADLFSQQSEIVTYDKVLETRISLDDIENTQMETMVSMRERGPQGEAPTALSSSSFTFEGNTDGSSVSDFMLGNKVLVEGSFYAYQDYLDANPVVLMEKTLAEENELEVGDTVTAKISGESGRDADVELTIVGIYESVEAEQQAEGSNTETFNPMGDTFYAPLSVVQELNSTPGYVELGSYYFDSVDSTGALQQAFDAEIADGDTYELATDYSDYEAIADPLLKVGKTSMIGLAGALGACALIILLAMAIIIGGRTRELGVLKAIGATDRQVIAQYAVEVVCICLVAIVLATGVTALISQSVGDWLLSGNQAAETTDTGEEGMVAGGPSQFMGGPMGGGSNLYKEGGRFSVASSEDQSASLDVVYQGSMLLYGILILLGISLLGMVVPLIWITRLRPARVLSME
ncbi:MAG: ABC transporter permease [Actinobacteria bacterium]|jgi:putative ABC transport system permease protein|nr:MAG: ABC transporter permease [Actinomycetota bacterium]